MINSQRKKEIIEYLSDTDYRTLKDIADKFAISMNTARRDINELAEQNLVKKYKLYAQQCTDPQIRTKCEEIASKHQSHFSRLLSHLN